MFGHTNRQTNGQTFKYTNRIFIGANKIFGHTNRQTNGHTFGYTNRIFGRTNKIFGHTNRQTNGHIRIHKQPNKRTEPRTFANFNIDYNGGEKVKIKQQKYLLNLVPKSRLMF